MKHIVRIVCWSLGTLIWVQGVDNLARSQSISPATDGTGTTVTQTGNRFDIGGGTQAGSNLYQSFQRFGLNQNQIANFLSNPSIQNILGRVGGGDPSVINGLIQVTGGNSNLFLVNPAGIVFGSSASLNVPSTFTATTANGIQVGSQWFGVNSTAESLSTLTGTPNAFAFTSTQPGAIFNAGNLAVPPGQSLTLVGGAVLNIGTLTAPGGTITIAAVPGEKLVRLSPSGGVLSLDLPLDTKTTLSANAQPITPLSLPALLVRSSIPVATGVSVENGVVKLTDPGLSVPAGPGTAIASGTLDTAGSQTGGTVNILGDKVGLVGATINASGSTGGGTVLIGGEYQGRGAVTNASRTFVSDDSVIRANALTSGDGGRVIVWADNTTQFLSTISTRGGSQSGNGGFVEVSGKQNLQYLGTVDTSAPNGSFGTLLLDPADITVTPGGTAGGFTGQVLAGDADPTTISQNQLQSLPGNTNVVIQASNTITIQPLGTLTFASGSGTIEFQAGGAFSMASTDSISSSGRNLSISGASLTLGSIEGSSGAINLTATNGGINANRVNSLFPGLSTGNGGSVTLSATNGNITLRSISTISGLGGNGGNVAATVSGGSFTAQSVETVSTGGIPGNVTINAMGGITISTLLDAKTGGVAILNGVRLNGSTFSTLRGNAPIRVGGIGTPGTPGTSGTPSVTLGPLDSLDRANTTATLSGRRPSSSNLTGPFGIPLPGPNFAARFNAYQAGQQADESAYYRKQNERRAARAESWAEWEKGFGDWHASWGEFRAKNGDAQGAASEAYKADVRYGYADDYARQAESIRNR